MLAAVIARLFFEGKACTAEDDQIAANCFFINVVLACEFSDGTTSRTRGQGCEQLPLPK